MIVDVFEFFSLDKNSFKSYLNITNQVILYVNLLRAAFLPATLSVNESDVDDVDERSSYGIWPDIHISAQTHAHCVRTIR